MFLFDSVQRLISLLESFRLEETHEMPQMEPGESCGNWGEVSAPRFIEFLQQCGLVTIGNLRDAFLRQNLDTAYDILGLEMSTIHPVQATSSQRSLVSEQGQQNFPVDEINKERGEIVVGAGRRPNSTTYS